VFRHPCLSRGDFIKRVIGFGRYDPDAKRYHLAEQQQTVAIPMRVCSRQRWNIKAAQVIPPRCANGAVGRGAECLKQRFIVLPNGVEYTVLNHRQS
jgi:signal peptidase I